MADKGKLNGKVAIITGSSSGLGAGIAIEFSQEGASVVITGRNEEKLNEVAKQCEAVSKGGTKPLVVIGDILAEETQKELIDKTINHFGKVDILVNNAGTLNYIPFEMKTLKNLDEHLDVHLRVPYHLTQLALDHLKKTKGVVINMSSIASVRPIFQMALDYSIAKAAQDQFTRYQAAALAADGIRVNSLNPGIVPTEIQKKFVNYNEEAIKQFTDRSRKYSAMNRNGTIQEVAKAAVFLASDDASFITGVNLPVDGGTAIKLDDL